MSSEPIADYALLSDCSSAALVSAARSVDWLCFPRFDSPSVFGSLLGPDTGFWSIRSAGESSTRSRYLDPTMVLETTQDEAGKFFQFLATAAARQLASGEELQIVFGAGGERELPERELPHLPGRRSSSPVRVGNGAWDQRQLDVYGELLDAAATLPEYLAELAPETRLFLADAADAAASRWRSADHSIWEDAREQIAASIRTEGRSNRGRRTGSCCARSGWPTPWPSPGAPNTPGRSSNGLPDSPQIWA